MGGAHMCSVPQNTLSRLFAISSYDSGCPRTLGRAVRSAMHGDQCEQTTVRGGFACRSCPWALVPRSRACAARLITCDQIHEMRAHIMDYRATHTHTHTHTHYVFMSYHDSMPWQRARGVEQCGRGGGGWRVAGGGWRSQWQCSARTTRASGDKLSATRDGLRIAEDDALSSSSSSSSCLLSPPAGAPPTRVASVHAACAQIIHGGGNLRRRAGQHMAAHGSLAAINSDDKRWRRTGCHVLSGRAAARAVHECPQLSDRTAARPLLRVHLLRLLPEATDHAAPQARAVSAPAAGVPPRLR
jgi:hypothetical protein